MIRPALGSNVPLLVMFDFSSSTLLVPVNITLADGSIVRLLHIAVGISTSGILVGPVGISTSVVTIGMVPQLQLSGSDHAVLAEPSHVLFTSSTTFAELLVIIGGQVPDISTSYKPVIPVTLLIVSVLV